MTILDRAQLTIAIPLYHAKNWIPVILDNIRYMPRNARIVLSDEVSSDDSAWRIAEKLAGDPRIEVRMQEGEPGWRQHCNALISCCETPYFSLLPQDDSIGPGYFQKLLRVIAEKPDIGISFGQIVGTYGVNEAPFWFRSMPAISTKEASWKTAIDLDRRWNLGIAFRGVIRKEVLSQFDTHQPESCSDQIWVFNMALKKTIAEVPECVYLKRLHPTNTHSAWPKLQSAERYEQLRIQIRQVLQGSDRLDAERYLAEQYQPVTGQS